MPSAGGLTSRESPRHLDDRLANRVGIETVQPAKTFRASDDRDQALVAPPRIRRGHTMRLIPSALIVAAALALSTPAAYAVPVTFAVTLTAAQEVPPSGSPATGNAVVTLDA